MPPFFCFRFQMLEVERKARKLDARKKVDERLAKEELKTNIADSERFVLPSGQEIGAPSTCCR